MFSVKLLALMDRFTLKASGLLIGLMPAILFNIFFGAVVIYNPDAVGTLGRILCSLYSISGCAFILFMMFHVVFRQHCIPTSTHISSPKRMTAKRTTNTG